MNSQNPNPTVRSTNANDMAEYCSIDSCGMPGANRIGFPGHGLETVAFICTRHLSALHDAIEQQLEISGRACDSCGQWKHTGECKPEGWDVIVADSFGHAGDFGPYLCNRIKLGGGDSGLQFEIRATYHRRAPLPGDKVSLTVWTRDTMTLLNDCALEFGSVRRAIEYAQRRDWTPRIEAINTRAGKRAADRMVAAYRRISLAELEADAKAQAERDRLMPKMAALRRRKGIPAGSIPKPVHCAACAEGGKPGPKRAKLGHLTGCEMDGIAPCRICGGPWVAADSEYGDDETAHLTCLGQRPHPLPGPMAARRRR